MCLISVIIGELSVIKNTVVKKRTKQVNVKRDERGGEETKVEERNGQHDTKTLESRQFNTQTKLQTSQQND